MPKAERTYREDGREFGVRVFCPGCQEPHVLPTSGEVFWSFNGDMESPGFRPNLLISAFKVVGTQVVRVTKCHSNIRAGRIEYLLDSDHDLAGESIELPDVVAAMAGWSK